MGYTLRPGVSFCQIERSAIFLDLLEDRYFCLGDRASAAFFDLVQEPSLTIGPDWPAYDLTVQGILIQTAGAVSPVECAAKPMRGTLVDFNAKAGMSRDGLDAIRLRFAAEIGVKVFGLARCIRMAEVRRLQHGRRVDRQLAIRASSAFAWASLWRSRQQRCLSISIATVEWLARRGGRSELIFGVRLHPFQAHCWVQCDDLLINDTIDAIRNFTPILVK